MQKLRIRISEEKKKQNKKEEKEEDEKKIATRRMNRAVNSVIIKKSRHPVCMYANCLYSILICYDFSTYAFLACTAYLLFSFFLKIFRVKYYFAPFSLFTPMKLLMFVVVIASGGCIDVYLFFFIICLLYSLNSVFFVLFCFHVI